MGIREESICHNLGRPRRPRSEWGKGDMGCEIEKRGADGKIG